MFKLLADRFARWNKARKERGRLMRLLGNDDRTLEDIGLRRADVEEALRLPPWHDAEQEARRLSHRSLVLDGRI